MDKQQSPLESMVGSNMKALTQRQFWQGKKVFLTGNTGFKGSWLSIWLLDMGADICGYALTPPTSPSLFDTCNLAKQMNCIIGDIRDYQNLADTIAKFKPEIVIHMAAQPLVRDSYKIPIETYATNVMGTVNILEAVRHTDSIRSVVNVTTDKCYENKEWHWGYRENEAMGGYDPYSASKGCSELVTASYRQSFFNPQKYNTDHQVALASARAGNVIGGGDWATDRLIPDILKSISTGQKVNIRSPHAIRPWQHVLEPLSGYLLLAEKLYNEGIKFSEGWNFGPEDKDAKSVEYIVNHLCKLWGKDASYTIDSNPQPHEAGYLKLDISKARNLLNWQPRWSLDIALNKIINWQQAYQTAKTMQETCLAQIHEYEKTV